MTHWESVTRAGCPPAARWSWRCFGFDITEIFCSWWSGAPNNLPTSGCFPPSSCRRGGIIIGPGGVWRSQVARARKPRVGGRSRGRRRPGRREMTNKLTITKKKTFQQDTKQKHLRCDREGRRRQRKRRVWRGDHGGQTMTNKQTNILQN